MVATLDLRPASEPADALWDDPLPVDYVDAAVRLSGDGEDSRSIRDGAESAGLILPGGEFQNIDEGCGLVEQSIDTKKLSVDWVIVTRKKQRNRNGNMVQIKEGGGHPGLDLTYHMLSPIVLFNHGFPDPNPIALTKTPDKAKYTIRALARRAIATTYFVRRKSEDPESETEQEFVTQTAETTFALIEAGAMNANSISYLPILARRLKDDDLSTSPEDGVENLQGWWGGWDFVHTELLEDSIVPIGADRGSLRQWIDRGSVHGAKIQGDYAKVLQAYAGQAPVMIGYHPNRDNIEMDAPVAVSERQASITLQSGTVIEVQAPVTELAWLSSAVSGGMPAQQVIGESGYGRWTPGEPASDISQTIDAAQEGIEAPADQTPIVASQQVAMQSMMTRLIAQNVLPMVEQMTDAAQQVNAAVGQIAENAKRQRGEF